MNIGLYNVRVGTYATGGTETFIREMSDQLSREHEVFVYTAGENITPELQSLDVTVKTVPFVREGELINNIISNTTPLHTHEVESLSMYWNGRIRNFFEQIDQEIDVLSTHSLLDNALVSPCVSVPVVFRVAGIRQESLRWRQFLKRDQSSIRLSNSEATAKRLRKWLDKDVDGVVYAGLDLEQFSPDGSAASRPDMPVILYLGRLDEGKGLFDLLDAHSKLCQSRQIMLRLVGDGGATDDLREYARTLGTREQVEFVGVVPHSRVQEYYRSADVYCLPSYSEGFPLGNIEAMACGTPVVSTDIAPIREQINNGETGLLVEPGNVSELESKLSRLIEDEQLRSALSSQAQKWVQQLSWEQQASKFESFYQQAVTTAAQSASSS